MSCSGPATSPEFNAAAQRESSWEASAGRSKAKRRERCRCDVVMATQTTNGEISSKRIEDLDITASPCSHVFQCLNHLANERERRRRKEGEREWHTPHLSNTNAAGTAAALLKSTWSPKAAFWSLVIFLKSHPLMLTHTQTPIWNVPKKADQPPGWLDDGLDDWLAG